MLFITPFTTPFITLFITPLVTTSITPLVTIKRRVLSSVGHIYRLLRKGNYIVSVLVLPTPLITPFITPIITTYITPLITPLVVIKRLVLFFIRYVYYLLKKRNYNVSVLVH